MLVLALVAIAVVVNFSRTAPFGAAGEESSDAYAALVAGEAAEEDERLKCPCPTEVEKTDCDEGLCSVGLVSRLLDQHALAGLVLGGPTTTEWWTTSAAPDPDPPRSFGLRPAFMIEG